MPPQQFLRPFSAISLLPIMHCDHTLLRQNILYFFSEGIIKQKLITKETR